MTDATLMPNGTESFHHRVLGRELNRESHRLETFARWPKGDIISPEELARYGFYYTETSDAVKCYFCGIDLGNWVAHDVVTEEHMRWSRNCSLMNGRPTNNVPLDANFLDSLPARTSDTTGRRLLPVREWGSPDASIVARVATHQQSAQTASSTAQGQQQQQQRARYPKYITPSERLTSFADWPLALNQRPEAMADAGFFYTGKGDHVTCFSCGGRLAGWQPDDDPWVEHAKFYSNCNYVTLLKGAEFVKACLVQNSHQDPDAANKGGPSTSTNRASAEKREPTASSKELSDAKLCKICYDRPYDTTFVPCGHVVACARCASSVEKCPLCNEPYTSVMRVYLS